MLTRIALVGSLVLGAFACSSPTSKPAESPTYLSSSGAVTPEHFQDVQACNGLSTGDVRGSFFRDERRPVRVERLWGEQRVGARNVIQKPAGARIYVAAEASMSQPFLERVAHCHAEMYRATGIEAGDEPLSVKTASVHVTPVHGGYAIDIRTDDRSDAELVYERAKGLATNR